MDITPIYDLRERLKAAAIAGTGLIPEDFRLKRAVEAIQGSRQRKQTQLDAVYVNKENMWDKQYEKMFYPIE